MFYVYEHTRLDTGMVFYVGKGSGARLNSRDKRNQHWHNVVNKANGLDASKVADNLDEELAFLCEMERIDQLRRLGHNLTNRTDGGCGGIRGYKHTDESKAKISMKLKGRLAGDKHPRYGKFGKDNPQYGRKQSVEARKGMSDNCCMKRPDVVAKISGSNSLLAKSVEFDGVVYKTLIDLANHVGITANALRGRIFRNADKYGYKVIGKTKDLKEML